VETPREQRTFQGEAPGRSLESAPTLLALYQKISTVEPGVLIFLFLLFF
jgi:hypothetical protein